MRGVSSLWIANAVGARVTRGILEGLLERGDVAWIVHDPVTSMAGGTGSGPPSAQDGEIVDGARPRVRVQEVSSPSELRRPLPWNIEAIKAPFVWDSLGIEGWCVPVAIIDSGVDRTHPELAANRWRNWADPIDGDDNDRNGFIDDFNGFDFWNSEDVGGDGDYDDAADVKDPDPADDYGHGTNVAGVVAGTTTGVAPKAQLMAIKVMDDKGQGNASKAIEGCQYAVKMGAPILNLSFGSRCVDPMIRLLWRVLANEWRVAKRTVCASAGNSAMVTKPPTSIGTPGDVPPPWISPSQPALGGLSAVTTVGATNMGDVRVGFSSKGPVDWSDAGVWNDWSLQDNRAPCVGLIKPDVCAPGWFIETTGLDHGHHVHNFRNTSAAAPHVSGVVALMRERNGNLSIADYHRILEETADHLGPAGKNNLFGSGRIRADRAVMAVPVRREDEVSILLEDHHVDDSGAGNGNGQLDGGETADLVITIRNGGSDLLGGAASILTPLDPHVTILKDHSFFGDIPPGEARSNADDPFEILVTPDAPDSHLASFGARVLAENGCGMLTFEELLHAGPCAHIGDHTAGNVRLTLTDRGIIGFSDGAHSEGSGFVFPKAAGLNRLYIGSFWAATDTTYVLNRDFDLDPEKDLEPAGCLALPQGGGGAGGIEADERGHGVFDDAGHPSPKGITITQRSYAWEDPADEDYVIVEYELHNSTPATLPRIWLGAFLDWDLDEENAADNRGRADPVRNLIYMWRTDGGDGAHFGVRVLTEVAVSNLSMIHHPTYVYPLAYMQDSDRYHFLTGDDPAYVVHETPDDSDWSMVAGAGPLHLEPGERARVAFAILAGTSEADLVANADAARMKWRLLNLQPGDLPPGGADLRTPDRLAILGAAPNPFERRVSVRFAVPWPGTVVFQILDVAGREVTRLADRSFGIGVHDVRWDGRDSRGRRVAPGLYFARLAAAGGSTSHKLLVSR